LEDFKESRKHWIGSLVFSGRTSDIVSEGAMLSTMAEGFSDTGSEGFSVALKTLRMSGGINSLTDGNRLFVCTR
jgi:hypothetical protein